MDEDESTASSGQGVGGSFPGGKVDVVVCDFLPELLSFFPFEEEGDEFSSNSSSGQGVGGSIPGPAGGVGESLGCN